MQNPFTRCAYEVSTFLAPRSKVAHRSTLSSLLSIPVAITKGSSRKLVSMPGVGKSEGEDPVVASTPLMSPLLGFEDAIPALEPPSSATAPDTNPFSGVNAHAGTPFARTIRLRLLFI